MKSFKNLLFLALAFIATLATAQQMPQLPMDAAVRYGKLPNGLTYYIRHNALPENRANFYIAQKVGSVQEEESQRGLAHFLEHMCFNGTEHFPGNGIIQFCERIGVKFGQNLNAYTSTDETVYNIDDVPVTDENIDSCLLILHDWGGALLLEEAEIDKERGVIHEEWRMRSSAFMRIINRQLETLYPDSRYGKRMPIGLMSVIDNFEPEFLRAYYRKWYRPDLQGIIVVGDVDVDQVETKIKTLFADLKMPENPAPYEFYPVPTTPQAIFSIDKDKELTTAEISLMFKHEAMPAEMRNTPMFLIQEYLLSLVGRTFNARLDELALDPECSFVSAGGSDGKFLIAKTMDAFSINITPKPGKGLEAVRAVMGEVERVSQHGFNASEVIRQREEYMSRMERIYQNRDKQYNSFYVPQYVRHFLEGNAIPDVETEYQLLQMLAQQIPAEAVSETFKELTASVDTNFVLWACYPEKDDVVVPTADEFKKTIAEARSAKYEAYADNVKDEPLVPALPKAGKIKKETDAQFGYKCWTLSNGARVFWKQTDFNASQVVFSAYSKGGTSLLPEKDLLNGELLGAVINSTGIGAFTGVELEKKLAGKQVSCSVSLSQIADELNGNAMPKDLRTLFELIFLRFQAPSVDEKGYNTLMNGLRTQLENAEKEPMAAFQDSVRTTVYTGNPRVKGLKYADLDRVSYPEILRIYTERFAAAGDFDFYFTGAFDIDSLRLFTEQYIAPLRACKKRENFVDHNIFPVEGVKKNVFRREMETPQAIVVQLWSGQSPYTMQEDVTVNALGEILTQRYLKSIREEGGMAYSVGANADISYVPRDQYTLQIYCPVKPEKLDSALMLMQIDLDAIARDGVTEEELDKVRQFELKDFADAQKKNGYWHRLIQQYVTWGQDGRTGYEDAIRALSSASIQRFVRDVLLRQHNCITIGMLPANFEETEQ